jgi:hypothetical protein
MRLTAMDAGYKGGCTPPLCYVGLKFSTDRLVTHSFHIDLTCQILFFIALFFALKSLITYLYSTTSGCIKKCYGVQLFAFSSPFFTKSVAWCSCGVAVFFATVSYWFYWKVKNLFYSFLIYL